jgi:hypothetical protein
MVGGTVSRFQNGDRVDVYQIVAEAGHYFREGAYVVRVREGSRHEFRLLTPSPDGWSEPRANVHDHQLLAEHTYAYRFSVPNNLTSPEAVEAFLNDTPPTERARR